MLKTWYFFASANICWIVSQHHSSQMKALPQMVPSPYSDSSNKFVYVCHTMRLICYDYTALEATIKIFCTLHVFGPPDPWASTQKTGICKHTFVKTSNLTFHPLFLISQEVSRWTWSQSDVNFGFIQCHKLTVSALNQQTALSWHWRAGQCCTDCLLCLFVPTLCIISAE